MKSIWSEKVKLPKFEKLKGDKKTNVLIIGGGICGILCAYFLKQAGVDYILVEGNTIASGTSKNTTAKITSLHGLVYDKLIHSRGIEYAEKYLAANEEAIEKYSKLCENIDCDFERKSSYTYSVCDREKIEKEVKAITKLGFPAEFMEKTELPVKISGAVRVDNQAQFNPLKFVAQISKNLNIFEQTFIKEITPHSVSFEGGSVQAEKIIVATHFPFINKHGGYFLKLYQERSYVLALEKAQSLSGMYVDEAKDGLSFRSYGDFLLLGGGSHRTGKKGGAFNELETFKNIYYPKSKEVYKWATQDCMSLDGVPYIGAYSKNTPNLYVASGFNKWGMTSSMVAASLLCDMLQGRKNDFEDVFLPSRSILKPQLFINGIESAANILIPSKKRCPHLGCALKWNSVERTWDCPCHGSRFEENGKLIDNPSTGDADIF